MKKIVSVVLMVTLLLGSMGDGRLTEAQNAELQAVEYENSFRRITAGPDEEAGSLRIFCKDETAVRTEIYAAYEGESFSVRGAMEEGEGLLSFPEEGKKCGFLYSDRIKRG